MVTVQSAKKKLFKSAKYNSKYTASKNKSRSKPVATQVAVIPKEDRFVSVSNFNSKVKDSIANIVIVLLLSSLVLGIIIYRKLLVLFDRHYMKQVE